MDANATGHWRKALDHMSADQLFDLEQKVNDVTSLPGWEAIVGLIAAANQEVFRSLTVGPTRSHEGYARQVGYCAGLEEASNVVKAIAEAASRRRQKLENAAVADQRARQEA